MEHARETVEFARQQQGLIPPLRHSSFIFSCHSCTNWKTFVATCDRGVCESHRRLKPMLKPPPCPDFCPDATTEAFAAHCTAVTHTGRKSVQTWRQTTPSASRNDAQLVFGGKAALSRGLGVLTPPLLQFHLASLTHLVQRRSS